MPDQYEMPDEKDTLSEPGEQQHKNDRKREAKGWIISLAAAIIIALALRFFVFEFIRVDGPSMQPTLYTDEYVFMERVTYWFSPPKRGDIVICSFPNSSAAYVKRVIALPGERVKVDDGVLYINGLPDKEYFSGVYERDVAELTVPENSLMVMGDNRNDSTDSRDVGPIPYSMIHGKAVFVIWPFDKIHGL